MTSPRHLFVFVLLLAAVVASATAAEIVIGEPANSANGFPFGFVVGGPATRYQQAYASSNFDGLGTMSITGIEFYLSPEFMGNFRSGTYDFYLSTITAGIDTLSETDFDSNLGLDNTFFASLNLSGGAPSIFLVSGTPFSYNPAGGNLFLDIRITNGGPDQMTAFLSRNNADGIFSRYHNFGPAGYSTGWGLVTGFEYDSGSAGIPEPITVVLAGIGVAGLCALRRLR